MHPAPARPPIGPASSAWSSACCYDIRTTRAELEWFAQAFWAQSIDLKRRFGWRPPAAEDFPQRVYEALSLALDRPVEELQDLMGMLIEEWKQQAGEVMRRFGYEGESSTHLLAAGHVDGLAGHVAGLVRR